jgi:dihydrofolate reductase
MIVSLIAALANNNVIGYINQLPWHLPADLKHFKALTLDKPILMGRCTYESIGKALPGRRNIVISRQQNFIAPGCEVVKSVEEALRLTADVAEVMVIGGAKLYQQTLPLANYMYLTLIHHDFHGDTFFPEWKRDEWQEIERSDFPADVKNPYPYSFITYKAKKII